MQWHWILIALFAGCTPRSKFNSQNQTPRPTNAEVNSAEDLRNRPSSTVADPGAPPQSRVVETPIVTPPSNQGENTNSQPPTPEPIPHPNPRNLADEGLSLVNSPGTTCGSRSVGLRVEHLRLAFHEHPASEVFINWTTTNTDGSHAVAFDTQSHEQDLKYRQLLTAQANGEYSDGGEFFHQTKLTELQPNTTYYFMLVSNGERSQEFSFRTAPQGPESSFHLLGGGDSRSDETMRSTMNRVMAQLLDKYPDVIALSHGGDFVASDSYSNWDCWMTNHQLTTTSSGRVLPVIATLGNHEGSGEVFADIWASPGGRGQFYYTSVMGPLALITLNSEISILGNQYDFLEQELKRASTSARGDGTMPSTNGSYSGQKGPSDTADWQPLFDQHRVDLVLESDGHILKKTPPVDNGTIYVGEGGLGVAQRSGSLCNQINFDYCGSGYHVQMISIRPEQLEFNLFNEAAVLDQGKSFTILPKKR